MSIPTSKILKASKSLIAAANIKHQSPSTEQSQSQNVNIVLTPSHSQEVYPEVNDIGQVQYRDLETAEQTKDDLTNLVQEKDNLIEALSLIIDIYKNNPLKVNHCLLASADVLRELVRLLTNADSVDIQYADIECTCMKARYKTIKRIYIKSKDQIYSIDMCPAVLQMLENFNISVNFTTLA